MLWKPRLGLCGSQVSCRILKSLALTHARPVFFLNYTELVLMPELINIDL